MAHERSRPMLRGLSKQWRQLRRASDELYAVPAALRCQEFSGQAVPSVSPGAGSLLCCAGIHMQPLVLGRTGHMCLTPALIWLLCCR